MLAFGPPLDPMLGALASELPRGPGWWYEPKWDGFRVVVFRDGDTLDLRSRDGRPLLRYFPEVGDQVQRGLPDACVVDGELVLPTEQGLDFERLQLRLHPAESRIRKLAGEIPAALVVWDLLALGTEDLRSIPFGDRRSKLESVVRPPVRLTPGTADPERAMDWFHRFQGAGLDGVMAKRLDGAYQAGKRAMVKLKHERTIDAVVVGFRWHKNAPDQVGSLVLALFDAEGGLHPIGVASSFSAKQRAVLTSELLPLRERAPEAPWARWEDHEHRPDLGSRWSAGKDLRWEPIRLERVAEVTTTQHSAFRLRHPAHLIRWRPDKRPEDCGLAQLATDAAPELAELF